MLYIIALFCCEKRSFLSAAGAGAGALQSAKISKVGLKATGTGPQAGDYSSFVFTAILNLFYTPGTRYLVELGAGAHHG